MRIGYKGRPLVASLLFLLLLLSSPGEGCGPGRGSGRRRKTRKLTPLVFKQHVPNVSENTLGASGLTDGRIKRGDAKFKDLVRNNNPDILFKDEEGTGADRIMSQRCKDKLNTLAISVLNQWPGVKLRVTEAWDEDGMHAENSLHYEGRAVDITTSDRDRSKYGMLARLAVEAGFDWVYYETRGHIHCSVKSDSSVAINFGGCFPGMSQAISQSGQTLTLSELRVGDRILSMRPDGRLEFSDVIAFLDINENQFANYYTLTTDAGHSVSLTAKHLIHIMSPQQGNDTSNVSSTLPSFTPNLPHLSFAHDVRVGQYILFAKEVTSTSSEFLPQRLTVSALVDSRSLSSSGNTTFLKDEVSWLQLTPERIVSIKVHPLKGMYAPLTSSGTVIVDGFATSCYAFLKDEQLAHSVFAPLRGYHVMKTILSDWLGSLVVHFDWMLYPSCVYNSPVNETKFQSHQDGAHWYARFLYNVAVNILGMDIYISL